MGNSSEVATGAGCALYRAAVAGPVAGQAVLLADEGVGRTKGNVLALEVEVVGTGRQTFAVDQELASRRTGQTVVVGGVGTSDAAAANKLI